MSTAEGDDGDSAARRAAADPDFRPAWWKHPAPLGRGSAVEAMAGIAAPLLAGFSLTLLGVIASIPDSFRWPGAVIMVLVIAVTLLVACIQFGFRARSYLYSAADVRDWRPDFIAEPIREHVLKTDQRTDFEQWEVWDRWAGRAYNLAICVLAVGIALAAAPPPGASEPGLRWFAAAIALGGGVAEASWIFGGSVAHGVRRARAARGPSRACSPWEYQAIGPIVNSGWAGQREPCWPAQEDGQDQMTTRRDRGGA